VLALVAACANLASVTLARTLGRGRELAVRASLGAAPRRLVGERIAESLLVAAGGALVGSALAAAALRALPVLAVELPRLEDARFGLPAIAAVATLAGLAGLAVGLAPALVAVRRDPSAALHAGSRALAGHRGAGRLRRGLVVATTALAFVLIAGAALVVRSAERVAAVDPGFASDGRLTFRVALSDAGYPTAEDNARFADRLLERLGALPGVESVNAAFGAPFTGFDYAITVHSLDGAEVPDPQTAPAPQIRVVTPGWFRDHGIPLRAGRELTAADRHGAPPVVVLSEAAAREIVPDGDPLGREVRIGTGFGLDRGRAGGEVVGVVADLRDERLDRAPRPTLYLAYDQFPLGHLTIVVAAAPERIGGLVEPIRRAVAELDAEMPIFRVRSYETLIGRTLARRRLVARLLAGFALATGALAALGLFGVLAAAVVERRRELAVRGALGATPTSIVRLVVGEGVRLAALGVALGLAAAWPLTRYLQSELYELSPHDPATLAAAALGLAVLAVAVTAIPARRAARLDPVAILRQDA
jgi:predicted permease